MSVTLERATPAILGELDEAVASWQVDGVPVQLHPGDLGWNSSHGPAELADALRVWRRDGRILACGMVDDDSALIRMALAPQVDGDEEFAAQLLADLDDPGHGVLPGGRASVEARYGRAFRALLRRQGWVDDEPWTALSRSLIEPVESCGLRIETLDAGHVRDEVLLDRVAVQRASFESSTFTVERWRAMAASPAYRRARCVVGYDADDNAVAAATVWSAGPGRPGLIEPLGVQRDFRGHGHGRGIAIASAAVLRQLGSTSVAVSTPTSNVGGVAAYIAAGFARLADVTDLRRKAA